MTDRTPGWRIVSDSRDRLGESPLWHAGEGALRIKYPDNPVLPQVHEDPLAAAEEADKEEEPVTESLTLPRKLSRRSRPADTGA